LWTNAAATASNSPLALNVRPRYGSNQSRLICSKGAHETLVSFVAVVSSKRDVPLDVITRHAELATPLRPRESSTLRAAASQGSASGRDCMRFPRSRERRSFPRAAWSKVPGSICGSPVAETARSSHCCKKPSCSWFCPDQVTLCKPSRFSS